MYSVKLTQTVTVFIKKLELKIRAKVHRTIELLEKFGPFLREPHSKKIAGVKRLSELRVKQGSNIVRLFYFHYKDDIYIITSGYIKKDAKTNRREIEKAKKMMKDLIGGDDNDRVE